jgi:hypothetical protein
MNYKDFKNLNKLHIVYFFNKLHLIYIYIFYFIFPNRSDHPKLVTYFILDT